MSSEETTSRKKLKPGIKWRIRGNLVVPTGNPFDSDAPSTTASAEDESAGVSWLGSHLKLLKDHVLTVNHEGFILDIYPSKVYDDRGGSGNEKADNTIELSPNEFLCPGMIDLHIHAPQYAYTGTGLDLPLMGADGWLEQYTYPAESSLKDDLEKAKDVYGKVVAATLRHGTTTAVYFATVHVKPCEVLVDRAVERGQRALIGKVCIDREAPDHYSESVEDNVKGTRHVIEYIHKAAGERASRPGEPSPDDALPLVLPLVIPRFVPTCTHELLSELGEVVAEYGCHVTSHISESYDEVKYSRSLDGERGRTDAEIFDSHGLLTDQCILAHGNHISDADLDLLKKRGSAIGHCPLSNFYFAGQSLKTRKLMERGNLVGLGTDVAAGYSTSMWNSGRNAVLASKSLQHQEDTKARLDESYEPKCHDIDYRHAFYLATLGAARALNLHDRIGTLAKGYEFDAVVLSVGSDNVDVFGTDSVADVFQKLFHLGDDRNIKRVFVQGRDVTVKDKK